MMTALLVLQLLAGLPDPSQTPGAVRPLTRAQVCSTRWGTDRRFVTEKMRRNVAAAYGVPWADRGLYEFDHLVPRSLGGADSEANYWPQLWVYARQKDAVEQRLSRLVCDGTVSLRTAQAAMRKDWQAAGLRWPRKVLRGPPKAPGKKNAGGGAATPLSDR